MTRSIQIYDTTLRDGAQAEGVSFSLQDKLLITERLDEMGFDFVEGGYPLSNEKDAEYFQRVSRLGLKNARVCAFGMTRRKGVKAKQDACLLALVRSGAPVVTLVGKTWDFHVTDVLHASLEENLDMIRESVQLLVEAGREVIYDAEHFFDGWKANSEYGLETIRAAADAGARLVALCDTNGGSMPEEVARGVRVAVETLQKRPAPVGVHCHNDCGLAVANSLAAVDAGATQVQGTINGFGERCGNADLVAVIGNLAFKKDGFHVLSSQRLERLTELSRYVYELANARPRDHQPFVGRSAFTHKGGMHAHAVARAAPSYEHVAPEAVGNERRILVSELSGRSNIAALAERHHIEDNRQLMDAILARVVELENRGYEFEAAEASFDLLVKHCAGTFQPHFEPIKYHVNVENAGNGPGKPITEATVKLRVAGRLHHEVAEGDGPVNALDAAMRKALYGAFPNLTAMRLVDYKVRVVNAEAGTAARIRVMIQCADDDESWGTVGVDENIIHASWMALVDAIEYKLYKDELVSRADAKAGAVSRE